MFKATKFTLFLKFDWTCFQNRRLLCGLQLLSCLGQNKQDLLEQRQGAILGRFHTCNTVYMVPEPCNLCLNACLSVKQKTRFSPCSVELNDGRFAVGKCSV